MNKKPWHKPLQTQLTVREIIFFVACFLLWCFCTCAFTFFLIVFVTMFLFPRFNSCVQSFNFFTSHTLQIQYPETFCCFCRVCPYHPGKLTSLNGMFNAHQAWQADTQLVYDIMVYNLIKVIVKSQCANLTRTVSCNCTLPINIFVINILGTIWNK